MHSELGLFLLALAIGATCWIIWVTVTLIGVVADLKQHLAQPLKISVSSPESWMGVADIDAAVIIRAIFKYLNVKWDGEGRLVEGRKR